MSGTLVEFAKTSFSLLERGVEALERIAAALERGASASPMAAGGGLTIPFGKNKGTPLAQATDRDLQYVAESCVKTLNDSAKARWHPKERVLLAAINEVLKSKGLAQAGIPDPKAPDVREDEPARGDGEPPPDDSIPF